MNGADETKSDVSDLSSMSSDSDGDDPNTDSNVPNAASSSQCDRCSKCKCGLYIKIHTLPIPDKTDFKQNFQYFQLKYQNC